MGFITENNSTALVQAIKDVALKLDNLTYPVEGNNLSNYQLKSEKGAIDGYASLDSTGKLVFTEIPTGTVANTVAVGDNIVPKTGGNFTGAISVNGIDLTPEEGTFTPILRTAIDATEPSYTEQNGFYRKAGNILHFWGDVITSTSLTTSGQLIIAGLPYASASVSGSKYYPCSISYVNGFTYTGQLTMLNVDNGAFLYLYVQNNGSAISAQTSVATPGRVMFNGSYPI